MPRKPAKTTHEKIIEKLDDLPFEQCDTPEGLHEFTKACMRKLASKQIVSWRYNGLISGINTMIRIAGTAPQQVKEVEERIRAMGEEAKQLAKIH